MVRNTDDLADDRPPNRNSAGETVHDSTLVDRPTADWAIDFDENVSTTNVDRAAGESDRESPRSPSYTGGDADETLSLEPIREQAEIDAETIVGQLDTAVHVSTDDEPASDETPPPPSPLAEYYESFRLLRAVVDEIVTHRELDDEDATSHPLVQWLGDLEAVVYGDGFDGEAPGYGDQQHERSPFTIAAYREAYGDGNRVTTFHCVETKPVAEEVLAGLDTSQRSKEAVRPVAPTTGTPLPVLVESAAALDTARTLLSEFPSTPAVTTRPATDDEPVDSDSTPARFWDETVAAIPVENTPEPTENGDGDRRTELLDEWQSALLDLSRDNDLIDLSPAGDRLEFDDGTVPTIAAALDTNGELPVGRRPAPTDQDTASASTTVLDTVTVTSARAGDETERALSRIQQTTKRHRRERGVASLALAFGVLNWIDEDGATNRSPLFLVPVEVQPTPSGPDASHEYTIVNSGVGLQYNPALRKRLARDEQLQMPADDRLTLDAIDAAFETVFQAITEIDDWSVEPSVILGCFDFSKCSLYADLERNRERIREDPIVQALAGDQEPLLDEHDGIDPPAATALDERVDPHETFQVLDADSSQQAAIEAAKRGVNFVLQGPPGTGKSQTIANIIAEKLAADERVLFVSEKQAALDVVQRRLAAAGLDRFCLEIHGRCANRTDVLETLETALTETATTPPVDRTEPIERLCKRRAAIDDYGEQLFYSPDGWELTVYDAYGIRSEHYDAPRIDVEPIDPLAVSQAAVTDAIDALATLARFDDEIDRYETNPWRHTTLSEWGVETGSTMERVLTELCDTLEELIALDDTIESTTGVSAASIDDWRTRTDLLAHIADRPHLPWRDTLFDAAFVADGSRLSALAALERARKRHTDELAENYRQSFFTLDGIELADELASFGTLRSVNPSYRSVKRTITDHTREGYDPEHEQLLEDTRTLAKIQRIEAEREEYRDVIDRLGVLYAGPDTDWEQLERAQQWIAGLDAFDSSLIAPVRERLFADRLPDGDTLAVQSQSLLERYDEAIATVGSMMELSAIRIAGEPLESASLQALCAYFADLRDEVPALQRRITFESRLAAVRETICAPFVDRFLAGEYPADQLVPAFEKSFYTEWLRAVYDETDLGSFSADELERYIDSFRELDTEQMELARAAIRHRVTDRQPAPDERHTPGPQEVYLRRQIEQHSEPLRALFEEAGAFITRLTPCFMMSPLSVAQYCPADAIEFDTVIFDEASQIVPQDAVSSLFRADQVIVAGDRKQLPPTTFFQSDRATTDSTRDDSDSILEHAATVLPEKTLRWHYRSRSRELVAFSNREFYDGQLRTIPESESTTETGLQFEYVEAGEYDRGGSRQNMPEAVRVVDIIERHAETRPETSLGVVAFSSAQQQAIQTVLDRRCQSNPALDAFVDRDDVLNEFFVKNLETVQGDERDRMLFSVGYGPDADGTVTMQFGPLNESGGERRLNVAITRAKRQVTIVSSIQPEAIDCSRTDSDGVALFKQYLTEAKQADRSRDRSESANTDEAGTDRIVNAVADTLEAAGYSVVRSIDADGYALDLAIEAPDDPGTYVLGIECDGPVYRNSNTARDRERIRPSMLERRGWTVHRVWSPNWATNRERALDRLTTAIDSAIEDRQHNSHRQNSPSETPTGM